MAASSANSLVAPSPAAAPMVSPSLPTSRVPAKRHSAAPPAASTGSAAAAELRKQVATGTLQAGGNPLPVSASGTAASTAAGSPASSASPQLASPQPSAPPPSVHASAYDKVVMAERAGELEWLVTPSPAFLSPGSVDTAALAGARRFRSLAEATEVAFQQQRGKTLREVVDALGITPVRRTRPPLGSGLSSFEQAMGSTSRLPPLRSEACGLDTLAALAAATHEANQSMLGAVQDSDAWMADVLTVAPAPSPAPSPVMERGSLADVGAVAAAAAATLNGGSSASLVAGESAHSHDQSQASVHDAGPAPQATVGGELSWKAVPEAGQAATGVLPGAQVSFSPPLLQPEERAAWLVPAHPQAVDPEWAYMLTGAQPAPEHPRQSKQSVLQARSDALNRAVVSSDVTVEGVAAAKRRVLAASLLSSGRVAGDSALLPLTGHRWAHAGRQNRTSAPSKSLRTDDGDKFVEWRSGPAGYARPSPPPALLALASLPHASSAQEAVVSLRRGTKRSASGGPASLAKRHAGEGVRQPEIVPGVMGATHDSRVRIAGPGRPSGEAGARVHVGEDILPERMPRHIAEAEDRTAAYAVALSASSRRKRRPKRVFVHSMAVSDLDVAVEMADNGEQRVVFAVPKDYMNVREEGGGGSRSRLPRHVILALKQWMVQPEHWRHPYPSEEVRRELAHKLSLSEGQVCNWFRNERKRLWLPMQRRAKAAVNAMRGGQGGGGQDGSDE